MCVRCVRDRQPLFSVPTSKWVKMEVCRNMGMFACRLSWQRHVTMGCVRDTRSVDTTTLLNGEHKLLLLAHIPASWGSAPFPALFIMDMLMSPGKQLS
jgi:NMD protein affecting ribosome stability and mRNA decay